MAVTKTAVSKNTQQKKASRVKAQHANAPPKKASRKKASKTNDSQKSAPSKASKPKQTQQKSKAANLTDRGASSRTSDGEDVSGETEMQAPSKYAHTTRIQLDGMIRWMEKPSNRAIYLGESTAGKGMTHGAGVTKLSGFASMAEYVHNYAMKNDLRTLDTRANGARH
ncbi:hypothetical protein PHYSODRAFT_306268 [Phytophthora sojae]|uniref:Uncharacterized protein n=1 Tax=Phytophthora sojae (strain P6497) TaxID=1094619 RepID=G5A8R2_PHYSP|nr:hypothetical protein PHYSODRAFT_306268 [Phytophthora sojae]EGZ08288.1 hypothetical protein PHYSODRAFT_306268 [Phytophthora sojae]|eukprot:XP_009536460.1 hypothetical protein PHYSODRAFT_306268 [Phytophthora sojae]